MVDKSFFYNQYIENEIIRNSIDKNTIKSVRNPTKYSEFDMLTQVWFKDNVKPNYVIYYPSGKVKSQFWYENKRKHRTDAPAVIFYYKSGKIKSEYWYLNGKEIFPFEWLKENNYKWPLDQNQQIELLLRFG